jgi:hypothetical protein
MGFANRFRLWRIDASRVELENKIPGVFGAHITMKEVMQLIPGDKHKLGTFVTNLDTLISAFTELKSRCRAHSLSMLVPMGQEMSYRYQESLLDEIIAALNIFRERLANK